LLWDPDALLCSPSRRASFVGSFDDVPSEVGCPADEEYPSTGPPVRTAISGERPFSHELTQHVDPDLAQPGMGGSNELLASF
jgi:hypothetical protein